MGYQEALISTTTKRGFDKMIDAYIKLEKQGFYNEVYASIPRTVIQLKKPIGAFKAGQKLLWVCGERCFLHRANIFKNMLSLRTPIKITGVENIFKPYCNELDGINFNTNQSTENEYIKRWSIKDYAEAEHKKQKHKSEPEK